jgi:PAS domain S-box-containing protein
MESDDHAGRPGNVRGERVKDAGTTWQNSPVRVLVALVLLIVCAESGIMFLLRKFAGELPVVAEMLADSTLLVGILCPALFSLVLVPLLRQIAERRLAENALRTSEERYRTLIDSVDGIVWEADAATFRFTLVSGKAEHILGYPTRRWIDEPDFWVEHLHPEDREWAVNYCLVATKNLKDHDFEYRMLAADGRTVWLRDIVTVVAELGEAKGLRGLMVDVTERVQSEERIRASLAEKELLLKEIHHRVRNNLQIITGLLALQAQQAGNADSRLLITGSQNRIFALSLIYEMLSTSSSLTRVDLAVYTRSLLGYLNDSYKIGSRGVAIEIETEEALLDIDTAIPCGLIINELVANAFRFAFPGGRRGTVRVRIGRGGETGIVLAVVDDGVGLPEGMAIDALPTLGLRLVKLLVAQLEGNLEIVSGDGLECLVTFDVH